MASPPVKKNPNDSGLDASLDTSSSITPSKPSSTYSPTILSKIKKIFTSSRSNSPAGHTRSPLASPVPRISESPSTSPVPQRSSSLSNTSKLFTPIVTPTGSPTVTPPGTPPPPLPVINQSPELHVMKFAKIHTNNVTMQTSVESLTIECKDHIIFDYTGVRNINELSLVLYNELSIVLIHASNPINFLNAVSGETTITPTVIVHFVGGDGDTDFISPIDENDELKDILIYHKINPVNTWISSKSTFVGNGKFQLAIDKTKHVRQTEGSFPLFSEAIIKKLVREMRDYLHPPRKWSFLAPLEILQFQIGRFTNQPTLDGTMQTCPPTISLDILSGVFISSTPVANLTLNILDDNAPSKFSADLHNVINCELIFHPNITRAYLWINQHSIYSQAPNILVRRKSGSSDHGILTIYHYDITTKRLIQTTALGIYADSEQSMQLVYKKRSKTH